MNFYDAIVIGGGVVGSAIAFGLARQGVKVVVLDEGDDAFRASRGNFGLVWVQGKGGGRPEYQLLVRRSADEWTNLASSQACSERQRTTPPRLSCWTSTPVSFMRAYYRRAYARMDGYQMPEHFMEIPSWIPLIAGMMPPHRFRKRLHIVESLDATVEKLSHGDPDEVLLGVLCQHLR